MTLLLDALAAYRLTRLITADTILDGPRDALIRWAYEVKPKRAAYLRKQDDPEPGAWADLAISDNRAPKLAVLVTCRWCAGMWVGLGVVTARRVAPRAWAPLAKALSFSAAAALLAGLEDG